ncbi:D-fructose-responsive transcription factor [Citrobacter koseri]|uniref:D-fructose-responsive transcription factor n=1 Tax=Citrobacter koseri TaxID=545 RepID=A0A2X2X6Z8_CITKO|nr:D-fructose-responsive transcription factor [Citrobacter koseri]
MRLASFDDHYLYDSLTIPVDTIRQDNHQLAWHCFDLIGKLIEGENPEPLQRKLKATLQRRYKTEKTDAIVCPDTLIKRIGEPLANGIFFRHETQILNSSG